MNDKNWFAETGDFHTICYSHRQVVYSGCSRFQAIDILDTDEYGRMLFLDGVANSASRDEYIYHESLVHPAALTHPRPEKVCIIGGSEGATLREVFRHPDVNRVVMVDIDEQLVGLCREHLSDWSDGAFDDPRLELHFNDGRRYLEETDEVFDLIVIDLSDPMPDSPAVYLFTREFYQAVHNRLSSTGAACIQGESLKPWRIELHARMYNTLRTVFPHVLSYAYWLHSFHELHAQIMVSKSEDPRQIDLGGRLLERGLDLRYLTPDFLKGLFHMPGYVDRAYARYDKILTDEKPYVIDFF